MASRNDSFTPIMGGPNEAIRHARGEEVPGMAIHHPVDRAADYLRGQGFVVERDMVMPLYRVSGFPELTEMQLVQVARRHWLGGMNNDKITPAPEWPGQPECGGAIAVDGAAALRNRPALAWPPLAGRKDFWVTIADQPVPIKDPPPGKEAGQ